MPKNKGTKKNIGLKHRYAIKMHGEVADTILPDGWIGVNHVSGAIVYLHKETRVVTWSRPYSINRETSLKKHDIPLMSIPCLHQKLALEEHLSAKLIGKRSCPAGGEPSAKVMKMDLSTNENECKRSCEIKKGDGDCIKHSEEVVDTQSNSADIEDLSRDNEITTKGDETVTLCNGFPDKAEKIDNHECSSNTKIDMLAEKTDVEMEHIETIETITSSIVDSPESITQNHTPPPPSIVSQPHKTDVISSSTYRFDESQKIDFVTSCPYQAEKINEKVDDISCPDILKESNKKGVVSCVNNNEEACESIHTPSQIEKTGTSCSVVLVDSIEPNDFTQLKESTIADDASCANGIDVSLAEGTCSDVLVDSVSIETNDFTQIKESIIADDASCPNRIEESLAESSVVSRVESSDDDLMEINGSTATGESDASLETYIGPSVNGVEELQETGTTLTESKNVSLATVENDIGELEEVVNNPAEVNPLIMHNYLARIFEFDILTGDQGNLPIFSFESPDPPEFIEDINIEKKFITDGKTPFQILNEYCQKELKALPTANKIERHSQHDFTVEILIKNFKYGIASGDTLRQAKHNAAASTLNILDYTLLNENEEEAEYLTIFSKIPSDDKAVLPTIEEFSPMGVKYPYDILLHIFKRNFGDEYYETDIEFQLENDVDTGLCKYLMRYKDYEVMGECECDSTKQARHIAAQNLIVMLYPDLKMWGSIIRLMETYTNLANSRAQDAESQLLKPSKCIMHVLRQEMRKIAGSSSA